MACKVDVGDARACAWSPSGTKIAIINEWTVLRPLPHAPLPQFIDYWKVRSVTILDVASAAVEREVAESGRRPSGAAS